MQDDFPGVVALGDDALELGTLHHQKGADVALGHLAYGLEDRVLGLDAIQGPTLGIDELPYFHDDSPPRNVIPHRVLARRDLYCQCNVGSYDERA